MSKKSAIEKKQLKLELKLKKLQLKQAKKEKEKELKEKHTKRKKQAEKEHKRKRTLAEKKLQKHKRIIEKKKKSIQKKKEEHKKATEKAIEFLEKKEKEVEKLLVEKKTQVEADLINTIKAKEEELAKKSAKERKKAEKGLASLRNEIISTEKVLYTSRQKFYNFLLFAISIYLFLFSIILIKDGIIQMGTPALESFSNIMDSEIRAFGAGWFSSFLVHSGSAIAVIANTLAGAGALTLKIVFFILIGTIMGNISTPIFVSLAMKTRSRYEIGSGFELALANLVFSIFLVILVTIIQLTTGFFTSSAEYLSSVFSSTSAINAFPNLIDILTSSVSNALYYFISFFPILDNYVNFTFLAIGMLLFIISLTFLPRSILRFLGGRAHARSIINKYFDSPIKSFLIGLGIVILIASSSVALSLLVPLAVLGIIDLRKAIPYIIGINMGTSIDVVIAGFATGIPASVASALMFALICAFSILFISNHIFIDLIHNSTRLISRHMRINRSFILWFLAIFTLIPFILLFF